MHFSELKHLQTVFFVHIHISHGALFHSKLARAKRQEMREKTKGFIGDQDISVRIRTTDTKIVHDCKKNEMPINLYSFQVKLKTRMVIQDYRCKVYNKTEAFESKWALLADSL